MSVSHDLTPLRWAPPGSGVEPSVADTLWRVVRSPRPPCGALFLTRLTPAHGFAPPAAHELALRLHAVAKSLECCEGTPDVEPLDGGTFVVVFAGNFAASDLRLLRDRLRGVLLRWALDGGSVVRGDVTLPYVWSERGDRADAGDEVELPHAVDALFKILGERALRAVYQPIVSLHDATVLGWEALCRGPEGTPLETPDALFACAARADLIAAVDGLARDVALRAGGALAGRGMLFLNVRAGSWEPGEEAVSAGLLIRSLARWGIPASRVVVEITERLAADAYPAFVQVLLAYREAGFRIAVDDAGAGYASLQAIAEVAPDYVKVDRTLIQDIDSSSNRRALLSVIAQFAVRTGARLIAEGIETVAELTTLMDLGIGLGQGFLLARPEATPPAVAPDIGRLITSAGERRGLTRVGKNHSIQDLLVTAPTLRPNDRISVVQEVFATLGDQDGLAVTDDRGRTIGLLMKRHLLSRLALPYGHELYQRKTVAAIMDSDPLVVPDTLSVEDVTDRLLDRDQGKQDDHVIVAADGQYVGVAPARRILERVTLQRMSQARYSNPLTGLPGNIPIETEVNGRLAAGDPVAVLYVDLDYFKSYNDRYGVAHGDEVIASLARTLRQIVEERQDGGRDFLGHVGGDDFLLLTAPEGAVAVATDIAAHFDESVPAFYDREDWERGYLRGQDRNGKPARFPLISVSVAGVANTTLALRDYVHATEHLSALKRSLKRHPGSGYLIEGLGEDLVFSGSALPEPTETR